VFWPVPDGHFDVGLPVGTGTLLIYSARQKLASNTSNTSNTPADARTQPVSKPGGSGAQEVLLVLLAGLQGVLLGEDRVTLPLPALTVFPAVLPAGGRASSATAACVTT
jgi:hypothetical protein